VNLPEGSKVSAGRSPSQSITPQSAWFTATWAGLSLANDPNRRPAQPPRPDSPPESSSNAVVGCIVSWTTASNSAEEDIQVELVAQPGAARLDGFGSVVRAPIEAPSHHTLDAPPATAQPDGSAQADEHLPRTRTTPARQHRAGR
jgi:hypothetical protein